MGIEQRHKTAYTTGPRSFLESPHPDALVGLFDLRFGSLADRMRNLASITAPITAPFGDVNALTPGDGFLHFPGLAGINTRLRRLAGAFTWIFLGQQDNNDNSAGPTFISEADWRLTASSGQRGASMVRGEGQGIFRRYVPVIDTSTSTYSSIEVSDGDGEVPLGFRLHSIGADNDLIRYVGTTETSAVNPVSIDIPLEANIDLSPPPDREILIGCNHSIAGNFNGGWKGVYVAIYQANLSAAELFDIRNWMWDGAARFGIYEGMVG